MFYITSSIHTVDTVNTSSANSIYIYVYICILAQVGYVLTRSDNRALMMYQAQVCTTGLFLSEAYLLTVEGGANFDS